MDRNIKSQDDFILWVVCDTAKVRFFKQITTRRMQGQGAGALFAILQKYDFSNKPQLAITAALWGMGCACPASPAVGHGRCVGYFFGAYYLFLLETLVVTNKAVSLQCIRNGVGMGHKSPVPPRGRFSAALFYFFYFLIGKVEEIYFAI